MVQENYPHHPSFHRAMHREMAAPSFVLMGDGAAKNPPSSVIPPRHAIRNHSTIIRFDGRWYKIITPIICHSTAQYDTKLRCHHPF
ncbi:hypothetical protein [Prevotella sp. HJM029]|uniref:hypothetical protein n=1 Tax=Prevotella sp. HJM029 TaxID=1433844 RepID=UPI0012DE7FAD|nr:hypothetical protein [Prevotella sp. HJM029]